MTPVTTSRKSPGKESKKAIKDKRNKLKILKTYKEASNMTAGTKKDSPERSTVKKRS